MTAEQAISWLSLKPKDMPVFVLIGTDPIAPHAITAWISEAYRHNVKMDKVTSAGDVRLSILKWPEKKLPG